jgi:hypothetical protein
LALGSSSTLLQTLSTVDATPWVDVAAAVGKLFMPGAPIQIQR